MIVERCSKFSRPCTALCVRMDSFDWGADKLDEDLMRYRDPKFLLGDFDGRGSDDDEDGTNLLDVTTTLMMLLLISLMVAAMRTKEAVMMGEMRMKLPTMMTILMGRTKMTPMLLYLMKKMNIILLKNRWMMPFILLL